MIDLVQVSGWKRYGWLRHGFSTRAGGVSTVYASTEGGGSLNLGWTREDDPAAVLANRSLLLDAVSGAPGHAPITLRQIHTTDLHVVRGDCSGFSSPKGRALLEGDGLLTDQPGVFLGIQTADCVPVMLVDPTHRAVAVLHAGWRGTAAGMAEEGVARMTQEYGTVPETLLAAIGPSIGSCCYTVGDEVRTAFGAQFSYADKLFEEDRLDLWEANRRQLLDAGLLAPNITVIGECTGCALNAFRHRKYFSHRIDHGVTGRMMSVIGVIS